MSNGDPNTVQAIFRDIFGRGKSSALTSKNNEVILKLVKMHILEMEDVLFHLNSAVLMPENPKGKGSTQGGSADEEQIKVSGIKALALVFKQFEFDPEVKMVVSGHTDTSGTAEFNFKLSKERALGILYLIFKSDKEDSRKKWAEICYKRQKVEDYQQILTYFEKKLSCGCDPDGIDDDWGDKTKKATENFLVKMGWGNVKVKSSLYEIESDQKKRWPVSIWELVYNLYSKELCEVLEIRDAELESRRKTSVKFVDDDKKIVACGESFPIDEKEKSNYRSQKNRRVELLFFDKDEAPDLTCPADIKNIHKEEDCPLWRKFYFVPLYIDPDDLKAVAYHLKFVYYNKIKKKQLPVPAGLVINAYEDGHKEIPSETVFKDGIYFLKVKFKNKIKDPARNQFYFEYETADQWVYTKDDKTDPVIVKKTADEIKALSFIERQCYYDLPVKWSSRNYWTRYDGDLNKGEVFEKVFKDTLTLKPFGDEVTIPGRPLVFSLDDIVLAGTTKSQIINDKIWDDNSWDLNDDSRYTLFYIDYETKETIGTETKNFRKMKIYKPEESQPVFTDWKFNKNLIVDIPIFTRIIYFCNGFYDVGNKRSDMLDTSFDYAKGHVTGARLALLNDADLHKSKSVIATDTNDLANAYALKACGHYELHYFHDCADLNDRPLNYLMVYWNCRLFATLGGTDADVLNHRKYGMVNAMDRMNKNYLVEKQSGTEDMLIRLYFFMEAKDETIGGSNKCDVKVTDNTNGAWMTVPEAKFRSRDYQGDPGYFGAHDKINKLKDVDGNTYTVLTNHHEMGHATGNWDSYLYDLQHSGNVWWGMPEFEQPFTAIGGPYRFDELARMYHNRTPRLRNYWKYILWMNDESDTGKELNGFLKGSKYKLTFQGLNHKHNFFLDNKYKNVELASYADMNHTITAGRTVDVLIYKLGDDEYSITIKTGQTFNGVLVVKVKIAFKFTNSPGKTWTEQNKLKWAQRFNNDANHMLSRKFRIATSKENDIKNLFVVFTPSYEVYTGTPPASSHYNIEVSTATARKFEVHDKNIKVDRNIYSKNLIRCIFGKSHNNHADLNNRDFSTIVNWVGSPGVGNATYLMYDL